MEKRREAMQVALERRIPAPPAKIWSLLASADGMKHWLGPTIYEPRLGGAITFDVQEGERRFHMFGEVTRFEPEVALHFTWTEHEAGDEPWPTPTEVQISLQSDGEGTLVRLVHTGFEQLPAEIAQQEFEGYQAGWGRRDVLAALAALLEQG